MPRRLPVRPQVIIGNIFVVLVSWVIGIIYYSYVFLVWLPKAEGKYQPQQPPTNQPNNSVCDDLLR